jgi:hypothetical protein
VQQTPITKLQQPTTTTKQHRANTHHTNHLTTATEATSKPPPTTANPTWLRTEHQPPLKRNSSHRCRQDNELAETDAAQQDGRAGTTITHHNVIPPESKKQHRNTKTSSQHYHHTKTSSHHISPTKLTTKHQHRTKASGSAPNHHTRRKTQRRQTDQRTTPTDPD